jgi:putative membrane protein
VRRASQYFSAAEKQMIEAAIGESEHKTAGEIVPVVATASGRYDRAEDLFGLVLAVVVLAGAWGLLQRVDVAQNEWAVNYTIAFGLVPVLAIVLVVFLLGAVAATFVPALRLPFISRSEMEEEVARSAAAAFQRFRVGATAGATGILIYVSLYEHMVRVCGDDAINAKVTQADWDALCNLAIDGLRAGRGAEGLASAIRRAGELLSRHFPIQPGDRNEIANELRLID